MENFDFIVDKNCKEINNCFMTIKSALDAVPQNNTDTKIIFIKNGVYKEKLEINAPFIKIFGESVENTIICFDDASGTIMRQEDGGDGVKTYGTFKSATVTVLPSAHHFAVENLTIRNDFDYENATLPNKQAVALKHDGDQSIIKNVKLVGKQDTLCANTGRQFYYHCTISGHVDFIFGAAQAVFEKCTIISVDRNDGVPKGYIAAASTNITFPFGYLFENCALLSDIKEEGSVQLGRPWHPSKDPDAIANTVFKNCFMDRHISSLGWDNMGGFFAKDARFFEFENYGPGALVSETRTLLSKEQDLLYTKENFFGSNDGKYELAWKSYE